MHFRKTVAISISLVLCFLAISGCSTSKEAGQNGSEKTAATSEGGEEAKALKDLKITRLYHGVMEQFKGSDTMNNNKIINKLRENSGFNIQYESLPNENPSQKISIVFASGDVPDLIMVAGKSDYFKLAKQGALEPLDDLIANEIPNLSTMATNESLDALRYDGKLYAIPYRNALKVSNGLIARADILKELNLNTPTTIEEFYLTMKTIKEKKNITPLTMATSSAGSFFDGFFPFAAAFGVSTPTVVKDGELKFSWIQPEYKEFITTLKKWFDEGLLDPEFAVNKDSKDKLINGTAVFNTLYFSSGIDVDKALQEKKDGGSVQFIAPPVGINGQSGIQDASISTQYIVIPKQAKNKLGAAQYLNFLYKQETDILLNYGIKDEDYTEANGEYTQSKEQSDKIAWRSMYGLGDTDFGIDARLKAKNLLPYYEPQLAFKKSREETNYAPSIEAFDSKFPELRNFAEENAMKFIMGKRDLSEFDKFTKEFDAKGGKAAIDAVNEWYTQK
ncbi:extracellular solute-binding protein [Paenibacillus luteus]|uniref:extracellular solute-binding protein n=1 Tax=Paenibacillus luteus TaxID=2545753 RepID=UPI00114517B6|nr:extracellular solute-binding protein [Paenibacillus luteus]